jgi:hypothetical protein
VFDDLSLVVDASGSSPFMFLRDTDSDTDSSDGWDVAASSAIVAGTTNSAASAKALSKKSHPAVSRATARSWSEVAPIGGAPQRTVCVERLPPEMTSREACGVAPSPVI